MTRLLELSKMLILLTYVISGVVELRLALNGAPLVERPFVDHRGQWPPELSWTLVGDAAELDLKQTAYRVEGSMATRNCSAMRHLLRAPTRSNAAHDVAVPHLDAEEGSAAAV